jgi:hypothetical protein
MYIAVYVKRVAMNNEQEQCCAWRMFEKNNSKMHDKLKKEYDRETNVRVCW